MARPLLPRSQVGSLTLAARDPASPCSPFAFAQTRIWLRLSRPYAHQAVGVLRA